MTKNSVCYSIVVSAILNILIIGTFGTALAQSDEGMTAEQLENLQKWIESLEQQEESTPIHASLILVIVIASLIAGFIILIVKKKKLSIR